MMMIIMAVMGVNREDGREFFFWEKGREKMGKMGENPKKEKMKKN